MVMIRCPFVDSLDKYIDPANYVYYNKYDI